MQSLVRAINASRGYQSAGLLHLSNNLLDDYTDLNFLL